MVDFTKCEEKLNSYKGEDKKKTLIHSNKKHLVKFPTPVIEKNKNVSYINNTFSEYVGSNIFKILGFNTQNTILGKYVYSGKEKIVCGCEDFTDSDNILYEFESLVLSSNLNKRIGTEISDIMEVIEESKMIKIKDTKERFWDMFVVDSIIGNTDRHNGNWGFLLNSKTKEITFAPIYDCGSCLNPMLEDKAIESLNETELKNLAINCYSCIKENNKKINYMTYIKLRKNQELNDAIKRVFNKIDIPKINIFIDNINCMSNTRKTFYKKIIKLRYDIVKEVYNKI